MDPQPEQHALWCWMCQTANPGSLPPEVASYCASCSDEVGGGGGGGLPFPTIPGLPSEVPAGLVTEEQCAARELRAFDDGAAKAEADAIKLAAVGAVVTGIVGALTGYLLRG